MIFVLSAQWSKKLLALPESGMGYQKVNVMLKSGLVINGLIVQNAQELIVPAKIESFKEEDILDIEVVS